MTYEEAKAQIEKIKAATGDYQTSINKVQSELVSKLGDLKAINSRISSEIGQSDIVSFSNTDVNNLSSSIQSSLSTSASALSTLSKDATKEIERICNEYNSSVVDDRDEEGHIIRRKPRLTPETISLSSIAGVSAGSTGGTVGGGASGNRGGGGGSYYPGNQGSTQPTSFGECLSRLGSGNIYSNNISGWDGYVSDFLKSNNLSNDVESISIEGNVIKVKLSNGKEITISNVTSESDLIAKIKTNL